jgi:hypothetical protein
MLNARLETHYQVQAVEATKSVADGCNGKRTSGDGLGKTGLGEYCTVFNKINIHSKHCAVNSVTLNSSAA